MRRDSLPYWPAGDAEACGLCVGAQALGARRRNARDRGCCVGLVLELGAPRESLCAECADDHGVG